MEEKADQALRKLRSALEDTYPADVLNRDRDELLHLAGKGDAEMEELKQQIEMLKARLEHAKIHCCCDVQQLPG